AARAWRPGRRTLRRTPRTLPAQGARAAVGGAGHAGRVDYTCRQDVGSRSIFLPAARAVDRVRGGRESCGFGARQVGPVRSGLVTDDNNPRRRANGARRRATLRSEGHGMAPARTSWKGFLKLSLVSVPVKAFTANDTGAEVHLNQLHKDCNSRIKYQKVCPEHG